MSLTKYYVEYELTGNTKLWVEEVIYIDKTTKNVAIGKVTGTTYKLTVTGDTYSEQYFMRNPDTDNSSNNYLVYSGGKIQKRTSVTAGATGGNYAVQYAYNGVLSGDTAQIDYNNLDTLQISNMLNLQPSGTTFPVVGISVGDICRISGNSKFTDGYYVLNSAGSWVALSTW